MAPTLSVVRFQMDAGGMCRSRSRRAIGNDQVRSTYFCCDGIREFRVGAVLDASTKKRRAHGTKSPNEVDQDGGAFHGDRSTSVCAALRCSASPSAPESTLRPPATKRPAPASGRGNAAAKGADRRAGAGAERRRLNLTCAYPDE